jgi:diguanylate cyclase (GGDEF)-like protein
MYSRRVKVLTAPRAPLRTRLAVGLAGLVVVALVCMADLVLADAFVVSSAYVVPVALVAWFAGMEIAVVLAGVATVAAAVASKSEGLIGAVVVPAMLNGVIAFTVGSLQQALARERLLARTDVVTGIPNRRAFEEDARTMLRLHVRDHRPLTAVGMDLDGFKQINDTLGHSEGDAVLREVAQTLARTVRSSDILCRYGGDEFAVLFADTDERGAQALLARLHQALDRSMQLGGWPVTFSIGAVTFRTLPSERALMRLVDEQTYVAKRSGKDRLVHEVVHEVVLA